MSLIHIPVTSFVIAACRIPSPLISGQKSRSKEELCDF